MITVYTCILNAFDNLHSPLEEALVNSNARYVCYTNMPHIDPCPPWEFRPAYLPPNLGMDRASRLPKILPHLFVETDYSIWHDGCFALKKRPEDIVELLLKDADLAAHVHPARSCLFEEGQLCINEKIGSSDLIARQLKTYELHGHPRNWGLWACGFLARRHTRPVQHFNERWWGAYINGCERDQIAFPFALGHKDPPAIETIKRNIWDSPLCAFYWHAAFKGRGDVDRFEPRRAQQHVMLEKLKEFVGDDGRTKLS